MTQDETKKRIEEEADFVNLKRFDYSLKKLVDRYPDGCPTRVIASALAMSEEEVEECYQSIVAKIRSNLGITL